MEARTTALTNTRRKILKTGVFAAIIAILGGCSPDASLKSTLLKILPENTKVELLQTCSRFMGPAVASFSFTPLPANDSSIRNSTDRKWARYSSFAELADADAKLYKGLGVSATLLDGKKCIREIDSNANQILFGSNKGWYYISQNREIVAFLFDNPKGRGLLFIQAP